jgi:myosin heavy subunit
MLQARCRGAQARTLFEGMTKQECSATRIQTRWRGYVTSTAYRQKRMRAIVVQALYRGLLLRREIRFLDACASAIQASWRCFSANLQYRLDLLDVILVQSVFRRRLAVIRFQRVKVALSVLQSFARTCGALKKIERRRAENVKHRQRYIAAVCLQVSATNRQQTYNQGSNFLSTHPIFTMHRFDSASLPCEVI